MVLVITGTLKNEWSLAGSRSTKYKHHQHDDDCLRKVRNTPFIAFQHSCSCSCLWLIGEFWNHSPLLIFIDISQTEKSRYLAQTSPHRSLQLAWGLSCRKFSNISRETVKTVNNWTLGAFLGHCARCFCSSVSEGKALRAIAHGNAYFISTSMKFGSLKTLQRTPKSPVTRISDNYWSQTSQDRTGMAINCRNHSIPKVRDPDANYRE